VRETVKQSSNYIILFVISLSKSRMNVVSHNGQPHILTSRGLTPLYQKLSIGRVEAPVPTTGGGLACYPSSLKALEQQLKDIEDQEEKQVRRRLATQEKEDTQASDEVMRCISEISKKYSVKHCRKGGCVKKER
jgi:hypothetical protein